ncbi:MAG: protein kinase [Gammaproteobacteria bacterium]|nr:protein kinase [Gammaproteobacteria bacterium]
MTRVYLAKDVRLSRVVAVKVPNKELSQQMLEDFLHGSEILKELVHPNIVKVFDFKQVDDNYFLTMEYLPKGNLFDRVDRGLHLQALVKIIKDICRALDYLHQTGAIHGDVKPENILVDSHGVAKLTDFDLAHAIDSISTTRRGSVLGTPEYISPEQAAGKTIDGRSDLYSLGVVFYRLLSGSLPYYAETAVEMSLKHIQEPIPRLPSYLRVFQEVVDQALAKKADQRFANGREMIEKLDQIRADFELPNTTLRTREISTQEIRVVGGDLLSTPIDSARQERLSRRVRRQRMLRSSLLVLVLGLSIAGGGYYAVTQNLIPIEQVLSRLGLAENPLVAIAWAEAQSLRQDPNQALPAIVAAYRRVLAIDPDHVGAQQAVAGLAEDWKASIDEALLQGNLQLADTRLSSAQTVFPDDIDWVQLNVRHQNRGRAERLMVSTQSLLTSHGLSDLPSATAAIQSYQEVLRLAPNHEAAQQALEELAVHYAALASAAVTQGDVGEAISLLERATAAHGKLEALDDLRKLISQATTAQTEIEDLLQQARRLRSDDQLIVPAGENAAELYHRVLAIDPNNVVATQGLNEITSQIAADADQLLIEGELELVDNLVSQAAAAGLVAEGVNEIRRRLEEQRARRISIEENLRAATELMIQGFLTAPVTDNAVSRLRDVQQIDPGNTQALELLRRCAQRLAAVAKDAYAFDLRTDAKQYLDLALTITPDVLEWVELRDSWESK